MSNAGPVVELETSELAKRSVSAVMVTYNPHPQLADTLLLLAPQVHQLIVVDNGSSPEPLRALRFARDLLKFSLIENAENLGIAAALNQGIRAAKNEGHLWVILFDQDSGVTSNFVESMLRSLQDRPDRERIASMHPQYSAPDLGIQFRPLRMPDGSPFMSMTSGALMPTWIFDRVGWFASEYFIDCVDWEFCVRCRAAGFLVAESDKVSLRHAAGNPSSTNLLGFSVQPTHHNAIRRYYIARNSLVFYRKYFARFPRQILRSAYWQTRGILKSILFEKDRGRKLLYTLLGVWDALRGRMGKREGLST